MVIGKGLLGTAPQIPCIRTRLQVTFLGLPQLPALTLAEPNKALFIWVVGGKMPNNALHPFPTTLSQSCSAV